MALTSAAPVSCSVGRSASWQSSTVTVADSSRSLAGLRSPRPDLRHPVTRTAASAPAAVRTDLTDVGGGSLLGVV